MKPTEMLDKIKETLGLELSKEELVLATEKLSNGTVVESNSFANQEEIFILNGSDRIPMPIGKYEMESGKILLVKSEGIIASLEEAKEEVKEEEENTEKAEELDETKYPTREEFEALKEMVMSMKEEKASYEEKELKPELAEEKVEEIEMSAEIVEPISHNPEASSNSFPEREIYMDDHQKRINEILYN